MSKLTQKQADEMVRLHKLLLQGKRGGVMLEFHGDASGLDFEGADLYGADLRLINLESAYLRSANLRGACLYGACLTDVNLRGAYLYGANLQRANLESADLYGANLRHVNLWDVIGDGTYIKNVPGVTPYNVAYTSDIVWVGCQCRTLEEWAALTIEEAEDLTDTSEFYMQYRDKILNYITKNPAKNTA